MWQPAAEPEAGHGLFVWHEAEAVDGAAKAGAPAGGITCHLETETPINTSLGGFRVQVSAGRRRVPPAGRPLLNMQERGAGCRHLFQPEM